jgi:PIN domain nuclease of toxin-antitoxin system
MHLAIKLYQLLSGGNFFLRNNDMEVLPITFEHIQSLLEVEFHHRDPFDRTIIAPALTERLHLLQKMRSSTDTKQRSFGNNSVDSNPSKYR